MSQSKNLLDRLVCVQPFFNWPHLLPNQQLVFSSPAHASFPLSLSVSLSLWALHSHSLHSSTWNKCMLVLVAPVAMLVSTGLSGWADLWCSTPTEISSQRWCLLLMSLQHPGLSQGSPIPLCPSCLICYWSCVWVHLWERLVFVLCFTLRWWGNVNSASPQGCGF